MFLRSLASLSIIMLGCSPSNGARQSSASNASESAPEQVLPAPPQQIPTRSSSTGSLDSADFIVAGLVPRGDSATVSARFGKPDSVTSDDYPNEPGIKMYSWYYRDVSFGIRYGVIGAIVLETPAIPTARGARVGDPVSRVLQLYGEPTGRSESADSWYYLDPNNTLHAIDFRISNDTVRSIFVGYWVD